MGSYNQAELYDMIGLIFLNAIKISNLFNNREFVKMIAWHSYNQNR